MKKDLPIAMAEPYIDERILSYLKGVPQRAKILDIACGQGYLLKILQDNGYKSLTGVDIDADNFKLSKKEFNFKKVDANKKFPFKDKSFDVVISSETIEHLENPLAFLREVHRILKKNGTFILSTPSVQGIVSRLFFLFTGKLAFHTEPDYKISGHIAVLPDWLLERFTKKVGFKQLEQTYSSFYIPVLKLRLTQPFFLRPFFGWVAIYKYKKL